MEKETKIKIIIFSVIGIIVLLLIIIIITSLSGKKGKGNEPDNISLTAQKESDFTLDDMIKVNEKPGNSDQGSILSTRNDKDRDYNFDKGEETNDTYQTADEDIVRLQKALRSQNQGEQQPTKIATSQVNVPAPIKQVVKQQSTKNIEESPRTAVPKEETKEIANEPKSEVKKGNRFFRATEDKITGNTVAAVVHGEQTITNKGTLKIRLLEDMYTIDGTLIPKDTYVYGIANINQERILINIESVRIGKNIYALNRQVFDQDGLKGINVPENLKAEIAKKSTSSAVQNADLPSGGGDILSRTANTVAGAAKSLLSKDAAEIKVTVKSNYKIYLK